MTQPTILLLGLGHLGGVLLEYLAREPSIGRIVAGSRDAKRGEARCNLARVGALAQGYRPRIDYLTMDLADRSRFAGLVDEVAPDLILSTASMQTWWLQELLPEEAHRRLAPARFGMWLPTHLAPTLQLMEALAETSYTGPVLTAPFPDVVNCILGRLGVAPTCGVGNLDEMVAKVRLVAAQRLAAPVAQVEVLMVAHHALEPAAWGAAQDSLPPYFLQVLCEGHDVGDRLDLDEILRSPYPLPGGPAIAFLTAGSSTRLVRSLFGETETLLHVPGPHGLPGGYPVLVGAGEVRPAALENLSLKEAIAINERSHPFDGIERIEDDGTAVFVDATVETLRAELGYDCERLQPEVAAERGAELIDRFRLYAARYGVRLQGSV